MSAPHRLGLPDRGLALDVHVGMLHWAVGGYLGLVGALMLVAPHQFATPVYATFQLHLPLWGAGLAALGGALLVTPAFELRQRWVFALHALAGGAILLLGAAIVNVSWISALNHGLVGLATILSGTRPHSFATRTNRPGVNAYTLTFGVSAVCTGVLLLLRPEQLLTALGPALRPWLLAQGGLFVVGGTVVLWSEGHPSWSLPARGLAHLLGALPFLTFCVVVVVPLGQWTGILYTGVGGALLALLPWLRAVPAPDVWSLRSRFALVLAAGTAAPVLLMAAMDTGDETAAITAQALAQQQATAIALAQNVSDFVQLHLAVLRGVAPHPDLLDMPRDQQQDLLFRAAAPFPDLAALGTFDADGNPLARSDSRDLVSASGYPAFEEARHTRTSSLDILVSPVLNRPVLGLGAPILDADGQFVGAVLGSLELERLATHLVNAGAGAGVQVFLVDGSGRAMAQPNPTAIPTLASLSANPAVAALLATPSASGALRYGTDGSVAAAGPGDWLAGYARVPRLGWGVVVRQPTVSAMAGLHQSRDTAFGILLLVVVAAAAFGWLSARWLTTPLRRLAEATDRLADGDTASPLPVAGVTEVAHLTARFGDMRQRLADRTSQLEAAVQELDAFNYSVSHDLRAPLRHVDGFSQLLVRNHADQLDDEAREYLALIRAGAQRMGALIDDLLKLSRIGRAPLAVEHVDLSALAATILDQLRQTEPERRVVVEVAPGLVAEGDPGLLRVVLENLLGNAWKFTRGRDPAHIRVGAVAADGKTTYFVQDDGAGFNPAGAQRLFGAFQRLHTEAEFEGTGIGLATVRRIVQRHGGEVWAEGEVDQGATISFTLGSVEAPAAAGDATWAPRPAPSPDGQSGYARERAA